jgi:hypothetical protein
MKEIETNKTVGRYWIKRRAQKVLVGNPQGIGQVGMPMRRCDGTKNGP